MLQIYKPVLQVPSMFCEFHSHQDCLQTRGPARTDHSYREIRTAEPLKSAPSNEDTGIASGALYPQSYLTPIKELYGRYPSYLAGFALYVEVGSSG